MKTQRPNENKTDACCRCGTLLKTPKDVEKPDTGELRVMSGYPPQWICAKCEKEVEA